MGKKTAAGDAEEFLKRFAAASVGERTGEEWGQRLYEQAPDLLRSLLDERKEIDQLLENECGGFYLSAPEGTGLAKVRKMLRGDP